MSLKETLNRPAIGKIKTWQVGAGVAGIIVVWAYLKKRKASQGQATQVAPYLAPSQSGLGGDGGGGGGLSDLGSVSAGSSSAPLPPAPPAAPTPSKVYSAADYRYGTQGGVAGSGQGFVPTGMNDLGQFVGQSFSLKALGTPGNTPPMFVAGQSALAPNPVPFYYNTAASSYQSTPVGQYQAGQYIGSHLVTAAEAAQLNQQQAAYTG